MDKQELIDAVAGSTVESKAKTGARRGKTINTILDVVTRGSDGRRS